MKAKELARILMENPELDVMISFTDHTDFNSKFDINKNGIEVGDPIDESDNKIDGNLFDGEGNYIGPKVILINFTELE